MLLSSSSYRVSSISSSSNSFIALISSVLGIILPFLLLRLAREEESLEISISGKTLSFVLLSLARKRELLGVSYISNFLSRALEVASSLYFYGTGIIISKLFSLASSNSTIGIISFFFSLLTSLRGKRYDYVLETNILAEFP